MKDDRTQKIEIDLTKTSEILCDACGGKTFLQTFLMRRLSAVFSPTGQEAIVPVAIGFECSQCGAPMKDSILNNGEENKSENSNIKSGPYIDNNIENNDTEEK